MFAVELAIGVRLLEMASGSDRIYEPDEWLASWRCLGVRLLKGFELVAEGLDLGESSGCGWIVL